MMSCLLAYSTSDYYHLELGCVNYTPQLANHSSSVSSISYNILCLRKKTDLRFTVYCVFLIIYNYLASYGFIVNLCWHRSHFEFYSISTKQIISIVESREIIVCFDKVYKTVKVSNIRKIVGPQCRTCDPEHLIQ